MDADRANCVINNKSNGGSVAAIHESGNNGSTEPIGTESSSDSVEPPKSPFINTNENFNAKHECNCERNVDEKQSICEHVENYTNSVRSTLSNNVENAEILNNLLSDENKINCSTTVTVASTTAPIIIESDSSNKQIVKNNLNTSSSNNNNSVADNQLNDDKKRENYQIDDQHERNGRPKNNNSSTDGNTTNNYQFDNECDKLENRDCAREHNGTPEMSKIDEKSSSNERINSGDNGDIDNRRVSNIDQRKSNAVLSKQFSISREDSIPSDLTTDSRSLLLVQNSSEDYISSDTFSSDSIDVRPIKCSTAGDHQTNEQPNCVPNADPNGDGNKTQLLSSAMHDDNSLRTPLLAGNGKDTDYNAINRLSNATSALSRIKGNNSVKHEAGEKRVLYNDYVNLLCDTDLGAVAATTVTKANGRHSKTVTVKSDRDEIRPLLQQSMSYDDGSKSKRPKVLNQKPKSIVKSPSTQNFGSTSSEKFYEANRKPRLSIQCSGSDPERPVLHVQFLSQHQKSGDAHTPSKQSNLFASKLSSPPAAHGEHVSYQNSVPQHSEPIDQKYTTADLINQMPTRSILRTSRMRNSISSSSSDSSSSSSSSSSDDVSTFAEAKPPDGSFLMKFIFEIFLVIKQNDNSIFHFDFQADGDG